MQSSQEPITVFILSFNRPIYLWACLDSLYRNTRHPARFIIADNASTDPLVRRVIGGFERRRMFHAVHMCPDNRPDRLKWLIRQHRSELGDRFAFVESDVAICDSPNCWLATMSSLLEAHPRLYMLGSHCLKSDFVDVEFARSVDPGMPKEQFEFLVKPYSPERRAVDTSSVLIEPHNPPGRLLMLRTEMLARIPIQLDGQMYEAIKRLGFEAKITTSVVHRHLTLLNFFDYYDYDGEQRRKFFEQIAGDQDLV
jgi:hypothetical protein